MSRLTPATPAASLLGSEPLLNGHRHNDFLNIEVSFLLSWLEGPTTVRNVTIANERIVDCTAGPPPRR